jgi:hypothetical protein
MKTALRTLESTIKTMKPNLVPLDGNKEKILRAPLINCKKWLPTEEL